MKLASVFLLWFSLFALAFAAMFFIQFSEVSSRTEGMLIHDQLTTKMLLVDQAKGLALWYGGGAFLFAVLMWSYMMVYSHRLTGPIYKMERMLEKCIHNKSLPDRKLSFRRTDAFHELAGLFNEFIEKSCGGKFEETNRQDSDANNG